LGTWVIFALALRVGRVTKCLPLPRHASSICLRREGLGEKRPSCAGGGKRNRFLLGLLGMLELPYEGYQQESQLLGVAKLQVLMILLGDIDNSGDQHVAPLRVHMEWESIHLRRNLHAF
jgi:hypothetical protein